jgi:hypothetical protein
MKGEVERGDDDETSSKDEAGIFVWNEGEITFEIFNLIH